MIDKGEEMLVTLSVDVDTVAAHGTRDCTQHERLHTAQEAAHGSQRLHTLQEAAHGT